MRVLGGGCFLRARYPCEQPAAARAEPQRRPWRRPLRRPPLRSCGNDRHGRYDRYSCGNDRYDDRRGGAERRPPGGERDNCHGGRASVFGRVAPGSTQMGKGHVRRRVLDKYQRGERRGAGRAGCRRRAASVVRNGTVFEGFLRRVSCGFVGGFGETGEEILSPVSTGVVSGGFGFWEEATVGVQRWFVRVRVFESVFGGAWRSLTGGGQVSTSSSCRSMRTLSL